MTILSALEALTEYRNSNLFEKVLTDNGLVSSGTYAPSNAQAVDLCFADILLYLATHPDITDGGTTIKYTATELMSQRSRIYKKWGLSLPENRANITAKTTDNIPFW